MNKTEIVEIIGRNSSRIETDFGANDFENGKSEKIVMAAFLNWGNRIQNSEKLTVLEVERYNLGWVINRYILDSFPDREWIWKAYEEIYKFVGEYEKSF